MTELEVLIRDANGLTELLRVAWIEVANPLLSLSQIKSGYIDDAVRPGLVGR